MERAARAAQQGSARSRRPKRVGDQQQHGHPDTSDASQRLFSCGALPSAGFNWAGICDEKLQEMMLDAARTFETGAQQQLAQRIHERTVDNAYWLFVMHDVNPRAVSPDVKGFEQAKAWTQDLPPIYIEK